MDENRINIISSSSRTLSKLQLLAAFFGDDIVYNVYLRSVVIHQLFENNAELDINKLELFHLQFTVTLIELLKKIKKGNERSVTLLFDEIQINNDLITKLEGSRLSKDLFRLEQQRQALKVNTSLRRLYEALSVDSADYPLAKNINSFSARFAADFYITIQPDTFHKLIHYEAVEVYANAHAIIQRRLMGLMCKYDFRSEFYCGLKTGDLIIEVYKFMDHEIYYIFFPSRNLFLLCDPVEMEQITNTIEKDRPNTIIMELRNKNDQLRSNAAVVKTFLPPEIRALLADHYKKISDIELLHNISDFDAQANILKTMLNTDII